MTLYDGQATRGQRPEPRPGRGPAALRRLRAALSRLSKRGRWTLAGLVLVAGVGLLGLARSSALFSLSALGAQAVPANLIAAGAPPSVAAGPPDRARSGPPPAPRYLVERLPVAVSDYERLAVETGPIVGAARDPIVDHVDGYRIEYAFDRPLTGRVMKVLDRGRVSRGHVIVLDPRNGRVLAYVSTDVDAFPPQHSYPAASLVKIVTAAAALHHSPDDARRPCLYRGNRYRLSPARVHRPKHGHTASLERALATSNNQCFAQLAVDSIGGSKLLGTIQHFGWLDAPAPGHAPGLVDPGHGDYDLGRLGCGLKGCRITPLHAAQLAATLTTGEQIAPWWVDRIVDSAGRTRPLPPIAAPRRIMTQELAEELRSMLVRTTTNGTARSAFRDRRGRPKLGDIKVAGKTGNLTGTQPRGRYEWFVGVAPAEAPTMAVAVLQLQGNLWWSKSSQIAADVLAEVFCDRGRCDPALAHRFTGELGDAATPVLLSDRKAIEGQAPGS